MHGGPACGNQQSGRVVLIDRGHYDIPVVVEHRTDEKAVGAFILHLLVELRNTAQHADLVVLPELGAVESPESGQPVTGSEVLPHLHAVFVVLHRLGQNLRHVAVIVGRDEHIEVDLLSVDLRLSVQYDNPIGNIGRECILLVFGHEITERPADLSGHYGLVEVHGLHLPLGHLVAGYGKGRQKHRHRCQNHSCDFHIHVQFILLTVQYHTICSAGPVSRTEVKRSRPEASVPTSKPTCRASRRACTGMEYDAPAGPGPSSTEAMAEATIPVPQARVSASTPFSKVRTFSEPSGSLCTKSAFTPAGAKAS